MSVLTEQQAFEIAARNPCNRLTNTVARSSKPGLKAHGPVRQGSGLYATDGQRKYINAEERRRLLAQAAMLDPARSLFVQLLVWTGARVSEALALTPGSFQIDAGIVTIITLKRRGFSVREVPIPPALMAALDRHFGLRRAQRSEAAAARPLWTFCRVTAWRFVRKLMASIGIASRRACPRGLRHGFGTGTLQSGVPLNIIQRWMGHARMTTTAIYAAVCGPEEVAFAKLFWGWGDPGLSNVAATLAPPPVYAAPPT